MVRRQKIIIRADATSEGRRVEMKRVLYSNQPAVEYGHRPITAGAVVAHWALHYMAMKDLLQVAHAHGHCRAIFVGENV